MQRAANSSPDKASPEMFLKIKEIAWQNLSALTAGIYG